MIRQRTLNCVGLGDLDICVDVVPPLMFWKGVQQTGWTGQHIKLLALLITRPVADPDDLAAALGVDFRPYLSLISMVRRALALSDIPLRIVSVKPEARGRVIHHRLELTQ